MVIVTYNKKMSIKAQSVLNAFREVIQSQHTSIHEPTPNEYFALIIKVIGNIGTNSNNDNNLIEILKILEGIIPSISKELVQSQFKPLSIILSKILQSTSSNDNYLYHIITILGNLLIRQDTTSGFWSSLHALQIINMLLELIDDSRTSLRKLVNQQLFNLLLHHRNHKSKVLFNYLYEYTHNLFRSTTKSEYKRSLYLLFFMESALALFSPTTTDLNTDLKPNTTYISTLFEDILKLKLCEQQILTTAIFRTLDATYQSPYLSTTSSEYILHTLHLILHLRPHTNDMETNSYICSCLANGFVVLYKSSKELSYTIMNAILKALVDISESEFTQVLILTHTDYSILYYSVTNIYYAIYDIGACCGQY